MTNKTRIEMGLKVIALVIWGMFIIFTCAGVWNYADDLKGAEGFRFVLVSSIAAFIISGVGFFFIARRVKKDYEIDKK